MTTAGLSSANRPGVIRQGRAQRSRVSNGNGKLLPGIIDERSAWVRRCKDILYEHIEDLGGEDNVTVGAAVSFGGPAFSQLN